MLKNKYLSFGIIILFVLVVGVFVYYQQQTLEIDPDSNLARVRPTEQVTFSAPKRCPIGTTNGFCQNFTASCTNITKKGSVIVNEPSGTNIGTIFLMTGGGGGQPYHLVSTQQATTMQNLINKGYRVVELNWANTDEGIIGYPTPVGAVNLMCAPTAVMKAFQTKFGTSGPVCAQGNSGGSMQIGYGLTFYNLGNLLDVAILTGGPPTASFTEGCNGINRGPYGFMPDKGLGPHFIDGVSGFGYNAPAEQMYCNRAWKEEINIYDFPDIVAKFDAQSLVTNKGLSPNPAGTYSYPNTEVYFIESQDDQSNANNIGKLYYNLISAKAKSLTEVSGIGVSEGGHNVPETAGGAAKIEELFTNQCK